MNERIDGLEMTLPAKAENVALVRHALAGIAEAVGMEQTCVADLKTVVTEACMNVVVHAYPDGDGPLRVTAKPDPSGLTVVVSDDGSGIRPKADPERNSLRLGLSLIAALSSRFEISGGIEHGTRITMRIPLVADRPPEAPLDPPATEHFDGTELAVGRPDLLGPALARIVGSLAARRDLPVDRLSDAVLLTDALSADAPGAFADQEVRLSLTDAADGIRLSVGPLAEGRAEGLRSSLRLPITNGSIEALADEVEVSHSDGGEYLTISFEIG